MTTQFKIAGYTDGYNGRSKQGSVIMRADEIKTTAQFQAWMKGWEEGNRDRQDEASSRLSKSIKKIQAAKRYRTLYA